MRQWGANRDAQCTGQHPDFRGMCENEISDKHTDGHTADMRMDPNCKMTILLITLET